MESFAIHLGHVSFLLVCRKEFTDISMYSLQKWERNLALITDHDLVKPEEDF